MAEAIGAVLAYAVGVAVSPIPIIAVILTLFSQRAKVNGPVFVVGWAVGLGAVVTAAFLIADSLDVGTSATADDGVAWVRLGLGVLLLVAAVRKWRGRSETAEKTPGWMASIDGATPPKAFGLAVLLSANPKNLALALGAATGVAQLAAPTGTVAVALLAFVVVGSASVTIAVVYDVVGGDRARSTLDEAKAWLAVHNGAVMAVLFLVFSAVLISQGLSGRS